MHQNLRISRTRSKQNMDLPIPTETNDSQITENIVNPSQTSYSYQNTQSTIIEGRFKYKNGIIASEDYYKHYCFVCPFCSRRYSSITGLNYHKASFDHSNPPPNYDPHKISKRGRPRGFRPRTTDENPRIPKSNGIQKESTRGRRRMSRPREVYKYSREKESYRNLTYAEAQRVVEIEQYNVLHRISVDEVLPIINDHSYVDQHTPLQRNGIKKSDNIPAAVFQILYEYEEDNKEPTVTPMCDHPSYFHTYENFPEDPEEVVEYEMDEEDVAWLERINLDLKLIITSQSFEYIMDKLEKESAYTIRTTDGTSVLGIEEDVVCGVCLDGDCSNNNLIVFCDICNMAVHQDCYGLPYVPEGQWLCRRCSNAPSKEIECVLCPIKSGVFKQTTDGGWCHIICAIMIPGVKFTNTVFLEPIDYSDVNYNRFTISCNICSQLKGAVIQCIVSDCTVSFHATCGHSAGLLYLEKSEVPPIDDLALPHITHRYLPYCSLHFPQQTKPLNTNLSNVQVSENVPPPLLPSTANKGTSGHAVIHVPVVSDELLHKLAGSLDTTTNSMEFIQLVKRYWQIKRYMRSGVPLLRRYTKYPRCPVANFKLNEKQLKQVDKLNEPIEKLINFADNLSDCISLLHKLHRRESLKLESLKLQQQLHSMVHNIQSVFVSMRPSIDNICCSLLTQHQMDMKSLNDILDNQLNVMHLRSMKEFERLVEKVFEMYFSQNDVSTENVTKIIMFLKQSNVKKMIKRKSSLSLPPSNIDIVPSNIDVDELVQHLVVDLSDKESDDENMQLNIGDVVWCRWARVRYFPTLIKQVDGDKIHVTKIGNVNGPVWVDKSLVTKLGYSSSIDEECLRYVIDSKSYGRELKRKFLEAYNESRMYQQQ